jgi:hypothetical protein
MFRSKSDKICEQCSILKNEIRSLCRSPNIGRVNVVECVTGIFMQYGIQY